MIKTLMLALLSIAVLSGCFGGDDESKQWTSYIYPDKDNSKRNMKINVFPSLEECREASIAKLIELDLKDRGFYKCGKNCEYHDGMKTEICEKMEEGK